jgi:hypothetical protein
MGPTCRTDLTTTPYKSKIRTGFVSYPRSGNSYIRSLLERATGFQTSSIYCDRGLQRTFAGECNKQLDFFVKVSAHALCVNVLSLLELLSRPTSPRFHGESVPI